MSLKEYFTELIDKVESTDVISNAGKDESGFYKPTKTIILRHLNLLRDLYDKPRAKEMVKASWDAIVKELPPEWLKLNHNDKMQLADILK